MSRKSHRVTVNLDTRGLTNVAKPDLDAILRAVDDIIGAGGRSLLTRILRGSTSKPVLENGLDQSPSYGYFRDLSDDETLARIDWMILNGYLRIEYNDRFPVLVFTGKGWDIAREIRANELLEGIAKAINEGPPYAMEHMKDRDREMIFLLLDRIEATGDPAFVPALRAWKEIDYKTVKLRIRHAIQRLEKPENR